MALESATYISDLVSTNPTSSDNLSQGDDHLRLLKSTIKATFPNVSGAVTPTHTELNYVDGVTSAIQTQLDAKAPLASPTFTGAPAAPTASVDTNTTQLATTAYVVGQGYLKSSTAASTYSPISHSHSTSQVTGLDAALAAKAPLSSPALTGTPTAPTAGGGTNTTQIATTAFVQTAVAGVSTNSFTLLGTINTTSGSSQTLSGLSLGSYRKLYWAYTGLSGSNTSGQFSVNGEAFHVSWGTPATNTVRGYMDVDLQSGLGAYLSISSAGTKGSHNIDTGITNASTSITVTYGFTMDGGSIAIYGVK